MEICIWWEDFEIKHFETLYSTDSRGLSPKATGLHLEGVGGDTLGSTLALPASWAEVGGANGGASDFAVYAMLGVGGDVGYGDVNQE